MTKDYPRILIIGLSFETSTGSGITLTNQFKYWDMSKLAVAAENIRPWESICQNNYQFGYLENKRPFPFSLIQNKEESGIVSFSNESKVSGTSKDSNRFKNAYIQFLHFFSLYNYSRNLRISQPFRKWILDFKPDFIYTTANELEVIRLTGDIQRLTGAKIITHIWDDLIKNYFNRPGLFSFYQKKATEKLFSNLLNSSSIRLCISSSMANEYYRRYKKNFHVFHNCLDLPEEGRLFKANYKLNQVITILYAGRLGIGISSCLIDVCRAIQQLSVIIDIEFHIQTTSSNHPILNELKTFDFVTIRPEVEYHEIPKILTKADLLLLPYNFDKKSIECLKLSMPTKFPEYMISGTPILLYAHNHMFITQLAKEKRIAKTVSSNDIKSLVSAIMELSQNESLREQIGCNARRYALNHFDSRKKRSEFADLIINHQKLSISEHEKN